MPLATLCRLLQITKSGNRVVANVGDGDFQFARPQCPCASGVISALTDLNSIIAVFGTVS